MPVIGDVLPAGLALALVNPLPVVAVILLVLAPRGAIGAALFLAGWLVGLSAVLAILLFVVPIERLVGDESAPTFLASIVLLALGTALLAAAVRKWRSRPGPADDAPTPGWMGSLAAASPLVAFGLGMLLAALNPKNAPFVIAAATAIGEADLAAGAKRSRWPCSWWPVRAGSRSPSSGPWSAGAAPTRRWNGGGLG